MMACVVITNTRGERGQHCLREWERGKEAHMMRWGYNTSVFPINISNPLREDDPAFKLQGVARKIAHLIWSKAFNFRRITFLLPFPQWCKASLIIIVLSIVLLPLWKLACSKKMRVPQRGCRLIANTLVVILYEMFITKIGFQLSRDSRSPFYGVRTISTNKIPLFAFTRSSPSRPKLWWRVWWSSHPIQGILPIEDLRWC